MYSVDLNTTANTVSTMSSTDACHHTTDVQHPFRANVVTQLGLPSNLSLACNEQSSIHCNENYLQGLGVGSVGICQGLLHSGHLLLNLVQLMVHLTLSSSPGLLCCSNQLLLPQLLLPDVLLYINMMDIKSNASGNDGIELEWICRTPQTQETALHHTPDIVLASTQKLADACDSGST